MDNFTHTNGGSHTNGGTHTNGGGEPPPSELSQAISGVAAEMSDDIHAVKIQLGNFETKQRDFMQRLESLSEQLEQRMQLQFQELRQQTQDVRQQAQDVRQQAENNQLQCQGMLQEIQGVQEFVRGLPDQIHSVNLQYVALDQRVSEGSTQISGIEGALAEEGQRRSNVEVSLHELTQVIANLRSTDIAMLKQEVDRLRAVSASGRRLLRVATAAAVLAFLIAGYVVIGKPGWQVVATYVEPLLPPWSI